MNFDQKLDNFKHQLQCFLQRRQFAVLLNSKATKDSKAGQYLLSRKLDPELLEAYDFTGDFEYKSRVYHIPDSVVIPLRDSNKVLFGVWIRFLEEKRFYIWTIQDHQKYWIDIKDPGKPVYLAESIFDAVSLKVLFNVQNIAACLGVSASAELIQELQGFEVVQCLDMDSAGIKGMLSQLKLGWKVLDFDKIFENKFELLQLKDYNNIINNLTAEEIENFANLTEGELVSKSSITAKIFLNSKL